MNLFRHPLAIFIILSWVMGIATVVLFLIPDIYWLSAIGLLGFVFFRESIPGPNRKWRGDKKSHKKNQAEDVESGWGIDKKPYSIESLFDGVGRFCIFLMLMTSGAFGKAIELLHSQRQNPLLIIGLAAFGLKLIVKDIRYFSNVPEHDLEPFYVD